MWDFQYFSQEFRPSVYFYNKFIALLRNNVDIVRFNFLKKLKKCNSIKIDETPVFRQMDPKNNQGKPAERK